VGLVGAGQMGTGLISQMEKMDGMRVMATADVVPGRAEAAYAESDIPADRVVHLDDDTAKAAELIQEDQRLATTRADWLVQIPSLDVIVECTGVPEIGAQICLAAIEAGTNIVNMNVETDATIGYLLALGARQQGVIYTFVAG